METLLIVIAALSTTAAFVLGALVFKLLRDERRRSDARVQVLMDAAGVSAPDLASREQQPAHKLVPSHFQPVPQREVPKRATRRAPAPAAGVDLELHPPTGEVRGMFAEPQSRSPWPSRVAAAAACAVLATITGLLLFGGTNTPSPSPGENTAASRAPLELLALGHSADGTGLTISGIVQNPRGSTPLSGVLVTALLIAQDGSHVGSAHAPLDFTRLRPGEESPFVVKVSSAAGVARYRVSFKDANGGVLGHVDRRAAAPVARRE
jgi:hypothetical protein